MKKLLNIISSETNVFVALGVYSLVMLTSVLYNIDVSKYADFTFFASLNVYSFSILYSRYRHDRSFLFSRKKLFHKIIFSLTSIILPFYLLSFSLEIILMLIPLAFISFLYPVGVKQGETSFLTLRELPYIKIFMISITWAIVTLIIPLVYANVSIDFKVYIEFFIRVSFVMAITLPFDIRDVKSDSVKMKTIPQILGVSNTKVLSYILIILNVIFYYFRSGSYSFLFVISVFILLICLISRSNRRNELYFFNVIIESISILLFLSVLY